MGQLLTLEFPLEATDVTLGSGGALRVELGNGVCLTTHVPDWVRRVEAAKLILAMEVEGSPSDAVTRSAPIE
jgi:hypothetical protein